MSLVLLTLLGVYIAIAVGFFIAIVLEAKAREFEIGLVGFLVSVFWLPWILWYFASAINGWWKRRK